MVGLVDCKSLFGQFTNCLACDMLNPDSPPLRTCTHVAPPLLSVASPQLTSTNPRLVWRTCQPNRQH